MTRMLATPSRERVLRALELSELRSRARDKALSVMAHDLYVIATGTGAEVNKDVARSALWCLLSQIEGDVAR